MQETSAGSIVGGVDRVEAEAAAEAVEGIAAVERGDARTGRELLADPDHGRRAWPVRPPASPRTGAALAANRGSLHGATPTAIDHSIEIAQRLARHIDPMVLEVVARRPRASGGDGSARPARRGGGTARRPRPSARGAGGWSGGRTPDPGPPGPHRRSRSTLSMLTRSGLEKRSRARGRDHAGADARQVVGRQGSRPARAWGDPAIRRRGPRGTRAVRRPGRWGPAGAAARRTRRAMRGGRPRRRAIPGSGRGSGRRPGARPRPPGGGSRPGTRPRRRPRGSRRPRPGPPRPGPRWPMRSRPARPGRGPGCSGPGRRRGRRRPARRRRRRRRAGPPCRGPGTPRPSGPGARPAGRAEAVGGPRGGRQVVGRGQAREGLAGGAVVGVDPQARCHDAQAARGAGAGGGPTPRGPAPAPAAHPEGSGSAGLRADGPRRAFADLRISARG